MRRIAVFSGFAICLAAAGAFAHSGATGVVKQRMDGMKAMSNAAKALGAAKAGVVPFSPELISRAASELRTHAQAARTLFPEGSATGPSEALPTIWTDRPGFDAILDDLVRAADALDAAEDETAAFAAADAVAETCKVCHAKYREKKL